MAIADFLPDWMIVCSEDIDFASPDRLSRISVGGEAVSTSLSEVVMASDARGYQDGAEVWSIV